MNGRGVLSALLSLAVLVTAACGGVEPSQKPSAPLAEPLTPPPSLVAPPPASVAIPEPLTPEQQAELETKKLVDETLGRVAKARGLPIKRPVKSRELSRKEMLAKIRAQAEKDLPMEVIARQGEVLSALELVPPDYDFIAGTFRLIEGQIAGFYIPDDETMYLADDLSEAEAQETLVHELVHALQDQSYALGALLKYAPGDSDRTSAIQALIEGDATSAMLDVSAGSAFNISESMLRRILAISMALTTSGAATPRVLQSSLVAPYADGFSFVQALRRRGDWKAVDDVWRSLPQTTEQLLHIDKLDAREPALVLPAIPTNALGPGWRSVLDDSLGEQGLRIVLEEWTHLRAAAAGAAGWGGDRYVVVQSDAEKGSDRMLLAVAWHLRLDTASDAAEVAAIVKKRFGAACRLRPTVGPLAWKSQGTDIVFAAGPYERQGTKLTGTGTCAVATQWAASILKNKQ